MKIFNSLRHIYRHPFNRGHEFAAAIKFLSWQIGTRTLGLPVVVGFAGNAKLVVARGMAGVTGSIYCGLHEFPSMGLTLHLLRPGDLFVDVGANVGSYTILAGEAGADCVAFEPVRETFHHLATNIRLNDFEDRVEAVMAGVGSKNGTVEITTGFGAMNHVTVLGGSAGITNVPLVTLDSHLVRPPTMLKIDVEGYEGEVLAGAAKWLADMSLLAVTIELGSAVRRYGSHENAIHDQMLSLGFKTFDYEPFTHTLTPSSGTPRNENNTIYVRNLSAVEHRLRTAKRFLVQGRFV